MRLSALNRLRLAFFGIGLLLLTPLALLAHSVNERLEAQRRLRHEVVADRIFDELERELTLVLSQEVARPSAVYDAASIDFPGSGSYVLGYFTSAGGQQRLLGGPSSDGEREQRVRWALAELERSAPGAAPPSSAAPASARPPDGSASDATESASSPGVPARRIQPAPASPRSSPEILKKLNRGDQERHDLGY